MLEDIGLEVTDEQRISIRIRALSPGRTTLYLSVFVPPAMMGNSKVCAIFIKSVVETFCLIVEV